MGSVSLLSKLNQINMHFSKEKTLVIIKPDGIRRSMIGEVIKRLEMVGLKLVAIDMNVPTEEKVRAHYLIRSRLVYQDRSKKYGGLSEKW